MHEHSTTICNGVLGLMGSAVAFISSSFMEPAALVHDLTAWMQLLSFVGGFAVSVLMAIKIFLDIRKRNK